MPEVALTGAPRSKWFKRKLRRLAVRVLGRYVRWRGHFGLAAIQRDGDRLGRLHHFTTPMLRRKLAAQMARLYGRKPTDAEVRDWLRKAYRINDRAALEIMAQACAAVPKQEILESVEVAGVEALLQQAESGQGAVLLGMHSGNIFALLLALDQLGLPITVVAYESRKLPSGFFRDIFRGSGVKIVDARPEFTAFYHLDQALKRGRLTFIPIDQIHKHGGVRSRFLGKQVSMPPGAAVLAEKHSVPLFPILLDAAEPRWEFRVGKPIHLPGSNSTEENVAVLSSLVDDHIRAHPKLWSWHQRRWVRYPFENE